MIIPQENLSKKALDALIKIYDAEDDMSPLKMLYTIIDTYKLEAMAKIKAAESALETIQSLV